MLRMAFVTRYQSDKETVVFPTQVDFKKKKQVRSYLVQVGAIVSSAGIGQ